MSHAAPSPHSPLRATGVGSHALARAECYVGEVQNDAVRIERGESHVHHGMWARWRFRFWRDTQSVEWLEAPPDDVIEVVINALENRRLLRPNTRVQTPDGTTTTPQ